MRKWWKQYQVDVPEGRSGDWEVSKFSISKEEADHYNAMASFNFTTRGSRIHPGNYTRLTCREKVVMSDTPMEVRDHLGVIERAKGRVLVAGLGLGMVVRACLDKSAVERVTVVENSPCVIELVASHLYDKYGHNRLEIIEDDIFAWKMPRPPNPCFEIAWFDIWSTVCGDHVKEMTKLKRRFAKKAAWRGCWREWEMKRANRSGRW